jgi:hypothetical protein
MCELPGFFYLRRGSMSVGAECFRVDARASWGAASSAPTADPIDESKDKDATLISAR